MKKSILIILIALVSCQKQQTKPTQPTIEEINSQFDNHLGRVVFWISDSRWIGSQDPIMGVEVTLNNKVIALPTGAYMKSEPGCDTNIPNFLLPAGTYTWSAKENVQGAANLHKWSGTVTLTADNTCQKIQLN
jgi:hypothetical protein